VFLSARPFRNFCSKSSSLILEPVPGCALIYKRLRSAANSSTRLPGFRTLCYGALTGMFDWSLLYENGSLVLDLVSCNCLVAPSTAGQPQNQHPRHVILEEAGPVCPLLSTDICL
jgi:hypothetical protein